MSEPSAACGVHRRSMIGRSRELLLFRSAFDRMLAGRRQLVLIGGEAGIGKSHCAEALAEVAEDQGALVLWGRCREEGGAPSYWPWVQILRAYVEASSLDEVRMNMGTAANEIAALVPDLLGASQPDDQLPNAMVDSSPARFRTFDAIRQFFQQASQQVPIILVLDNLHWADAASLALLEFLSAELLRSRLLIIATYRDADAARGTPLLSTLGGLSGDPDVQRMRLAGLSRADLDQLAESLCAAPISEPARALIFERTDGHPLFAIELIKVLIEESTASAISSLPTRIPAGIRETIGRRLGRLSESCNRILRTAAVLGRQFSAREVAVTGGANLHCVLEELEPAAQAGIVQQTSDDFGFQFTHALMRDAVYEDLPVAERLRLHGRAADELTSRHARHLEPALTRIAHHYYEAAALNGDTKAIAFGLRVAESAVRIYAYEDALVHYDRAIGLLGNAGSICDGQTAHLYFLKGSALKQLGRVQESIEVLLLAVNRTLAFGSAESLVDVLMLLALSTRHVEQHHFVPLLENALLLLPGGDSAARAKALATLAFAERTSSNPCRIDALATEALDIASRSCDAAARCACYQLAVMALRGDPDQLGRRLVLGQEFIAVARATENLDFVAEAYHWQALNLFESGRLVELEALLDVYGRLSVARFGLHQFQSEAYAVTLALLRGEWNGLDAKIEALLALGTKTRREDADGVYGAQMFALNRDLGRLQVIAPQIKSILISGGKRMWEPGLMLLCAELGLNAEARVIFDRLVDQECKALCRDDMFLACLVFCAETCCVLGDTVNAEALYRLLKPYAGQTASHPTAVCFGVTDLYLAMLARTANYPESTTAHFECAVTLNRAMRAWPYLARTLHHYGSYLLTRKSEVERRLGRQHLREAEQLAQRLGMARLVAEVDLLLRAHEDNVSFPDDLTAREVEVLRLLSIGRTNKDVSLVLAISLNTVATHVRNILNKTHCANRTEAAAYAVRHGLYAPALAALAP